MATETWEKVKVRDLRIGDRVQTYAFIDLEPCTITWINVGGVVSYGTDEPDCGVYSDWNPDSMVFRVRESEGRDGS